MEKKVERIYDVIPAVPEVYCRGYDDPELRSFSCCYACYADFRKNVIEPRLELLHITSAADGIGDWSFLSDYFKKAYMYARHGAGWKSDDIMNMLFNGWAPVLANETFYKGANLDIARDMFMTTSSYWVAKERREMIDMMIDGINRLYRHIYSIDIPSLCVERMMMTQDEIADEITAAAAEFASENVPKKTKPDKPKTKMTGIWNML